MPESIGALVRGNRPRPIQTPPSRSAAHHGSSSWRTRHLHNSSSVHRYRSNSTQALFSSRPASCGSGAAVLARAGQCAAARAAASLKLKHTGACPPGMSYGDLFAGTATGLDRRRNNSDTERRSGQELKLSKTLCKPASRQAATSPACMDLTDDAVACEGSQADGSSLEDGSLEDGSLEDDESGEGEEEEGEGCDKEEGGGQDVGEDVSGGESDGERESEDTDDDQCQLCGKWGDLLVCDGCELAYHAACVDLLSMPGEEEEWFCPSCVDSNCN